MATLIGCAGGSGRSGKNRKGKSETETHKQHRREVLQAEAAFRMTILIGSSACRLTANCAAKQRTKPKSKRDGRWREYRQALTPGTAYCAPTNETADSKAKTPALHEEAAATKATASPRQSARLPRPCSLPTSGQAGRVRAAATSSRATAKRQSGDWRSRGKGGP